MKISLSWIILTVLAFFGALVFFEDEPKTGRYPEARKVVHEVRMQILDFHTQSKMLPKDLSFITDQELKRSIATYNVTFDPATKEIASSGNWTYYPDMLHRFTLGVLGDDKGRSVGEPGFSLDYDLHGDIPISE